MRGFLSGQFQDQAAENRLAEVNGRLEKLAGGLAKKVKWHKRLHLGSVLRSAIHPDFALDLSLKKGLASAEELAEIKTRPGYRKLHEVCASTDVNTKIDMEFVSIHGDPTAVITLTVNQGYAESPDAKALGIRPAAAPQIRA